MRAALLAAVAIVLYAVVVAFQFIFGIGPTVTFIELLGPVLESGPEHADLERLFALADLQSRIDNFLVWPLVLGLCSWLYRRRVGTVEVLPAVIIALPAALEVGWGNPLRTVLALLAYSALVFLAGRLPPSSMSESLKESG